MNYDLGQKLYVLKYNNYITHGEVGSIRTTTYKRYRSNGKIECTKFKEYHINNDWHHDDKVFLSKESAIIKQKLALHRELDDLNRRLSEHEV